MIDEEDINFIKVFLIVIKGGILICRKNVQVLVSKSGKSLETLLQENRQTFNDASIHGHLTRIQFQKLFPINNQKIDIAQWDISLLTFVLLNVFSGSFQSPEIAAIKTIRKTRNNVIGHGAESKITNKEFACTWPHVTMALRQLSRMLAHDDQIEYIKIESNIMVHPFSKDIIERLEEIEPTDTFTQAVVNSIMPKVLETIRMESEANNHRRYEDIYRRLGHIEAMQAEYGQTQQTHGQQIALLRMQIKTGSIRSRHEAQVHIFKASNNFIANGPDVGSSNDEVESSVGDLYKDMEEQGVKVVKADEGSILLTVLCPTIKSMRNIVLYVMSPQIQAKLTCIEKAVNKYHACETKVTVDADQNSLETAIQRLEKELEVTAVYLTLECSGIDGVRNAFHMFENGESTNTLKELSNSLSYTVGEKVELQAAIDLEKLEDDIKKVETFTLEKFKFEKQLELSKENFERLKNDLLRHEEQFEKSVQQLKMSEGNTYLLERRAFERQLELSKENIEWLTTDLLRHHNKFEKSIQQQKASEGDKHLLERIKFEKQLELSRQNLELLRISFHQHTMQFQATFEKLTASEGGKYSLERFDFKKQLELSKHKLDRLKTDLLRHKEQFQQLKQSEWDKYSLKRLDFETQLLWPRFKLERIESDLLRQEEQFEKLFQQLNPSEGDKYLFKRLEFKTQLELSEQHLERLETDVLRHKERFEKSFHQFKASEGDKYSLQGLKFKTQLEQSKQNLERLKRDLLWHKKQFKQMEESENHFLAQEKQLEKSLQQLEKLETDSLRHDKQFERLFPKLKGSEGITYSHERLALKTQAEQSQQPLERVKTDSLRPEKQVEGSFQLLKESEGDKYPRERPKLEKQLEQSKESIESLRTDSLLYETHSNRSFQQLKALEAICIGGVTAGATVGTPLAPVVALVGGAIGGLGAMFSGSNNEDGDSDSDSDSD